MIYTTDLRELMVRLTSSQFYLIGQTFVIHWIQTLLSRFIILSGLRIIEKTVIKHNLPRLKGLSDILIGVSLVHVMRMCILCKYEWVGLEFLAVS